MKEKSFNERLKLEIISKYNEKEYNDMLKTISTLIGILISKSVIFQDEIIKIINKDEEILNFVIKLLNRLNISFNVIKNKDYLRMKEDRLNIEKQRKKEVINKINKIEIKKKEIIDKIGNISKYELNKSSILSGLFLLNGYIYNPENKYEFKMNINLKGKTEIFDVEKIKEYLQNLKLNFKENTSNDFEILIQNAEEIGDVLRNIKVSNSVLEFEDIRALKEFRNDTNRTINFEIANMSKSFSSSIKQLKIIEKINELDKYDQLDENYRKLINIRSKNPNASLKEIAKELGVSKATISLRFKNLEKMLEEN